MCLCGVRVRVVCLCCVYFVCVCEFVFCVVCMCVFGVVVLLYFINFFTPCSITLLNTTCLFWFVELYMVFCRFLV